MREGGGGRAAHGGILGAAGARRTPAAKLGKVCGAFRHTITHHHYTFTVRAATARAGGNCRWFAAGELAEIPLSTTARKALRLAGFV